MPTRTLPVSLETFIDRIDKCEGIDAAYNALLSRVQDLGFDRMTYLVTWHPTSVVKQLCLTNLPDEWVAHYEHEKMDEVDIVGAHVLRTVLPFNWKDVVAQTRLSKRQRLVFQDASSIGMRSGGTIPLHGPIATKGLCSFTNDMDDPEFEKLFLDRRHELLIISNYAHQKIMDMHLLRDGSKLSQLTRRESEILTWMARGKTREDTSEILSIGLPTTRTHLESIREKLNAPNVANAIAIAVTNGYIRP